jgi:hypothetical protein
MNVAQSIFWTLQLCAFGAQFVLMLRRRSALKAVDGLGANAQFQQTARFLRC